VEGIENRFKNPLRIKETPKNNERKIIEYMEFEGAE